MRRYQPTTDEVDALFIIAPHLYNAIVINNDYFHDDETTNEQRVVIHESTETIYKACLQIINANKQLPFG